MNYHIADTGGEGGINGGIMKPKAGAVAGQDGLLHRCR